MIVDELLTAVRNLVAVEPVNKGKTAIYGGCLYCGRIVKQPEPAFLRRYGLEPQPIEEHREDCEWQVLKDCVEPRRMK